LRRFVALFVVLALTGCARTRAESESEANPRQQPQPTTAALQRELRLTGIIEAIHSSKVMVPQIVGQNGRLTLTRLIPNGSRVKEGDIIAEFDPTQQLDAAFNARGKYEDLGHQVDQKASQNRADAEKRRADLTQAQADLRKAQLEVEKSPILGEIDRLKNDAKAELARLHIDSLMKSNALHDQSDASALRILELQRDRQKVAMERAQTNMNRLSIRAPLPGMVAHQNVYRGNTNGHAQEGDQLWNGQAVVNIFDPSDMQVRCLVGEPDGAALTAGARVTVYVDAYPDLALPAHFEFASPMAASALGSPIKTFTAVFRLDKTDPRLMPDLSAAVVIEPVAGVRK
jgi:multidrug efflux pump subunit AcrA (membrane-fusion protein)